MCGRYTVIRGNNITKVVFNVTIKENVRWIPRFNVASSQDIPVVADGQVQMMRWGLIPSWAKDAKIGYKMINARAETIMEKLSYRTSFQRRRCLIPADGFYEWRKNANGTKTPMYIQMRDQSVFAFAEIWDSWRDPAGRDIQSCTIIKTSPNELMTSIHDRMPVIIPKGGYLDWLDGECPQDWLRSYPSADMSAFAVSPKVNSPKNDRPELIVPAA